MIFNSLLYGTTYQGYIAGTSDGILTVNGKPALREILVLDASTLNTIKKSQSLANGHYLLNNLDVSKKYLVIARDYNREYEPAVFDYVTPATDLTIAQQQALWESWQTT